LFVAGLNIKRYPICYATHRSRAASRPTPRCDRFRSSPSLLTRWMGKNRQHGRRDVMTMCRNLLARANCWRKFDSTCPNRPQWIASLHNESGRAARSDLCPTCAPLSRRDAASMSHTNARNSCLIGPGRTESGLFPRPITRSPGQQNFPSGGFTRGCNGPLPFCQP
jgi:hypothetical protein